MWVISLIKKDASLIDRVWGINFIILYFSQFINQEIQMRQGLVGALVFIWAMRLSIHLHLRNQYLGEDKRYVAMREEHGEKKFWWYSFLSVFSFQGLLSFFISAPLLYLSHNPGNPHFLWTDFLGLCFWIIGLTFEVVGDWQLTHFIKYHKKPGETLTTGLWSFTRHPNYFGDAFIWIGYFLFACSSPYGWGTFFGPLIMLYFLRYISGVSLLEKGLHKSRKKYTAETSHIPAWIPNPIQIAQAIQKLYEPNKKP
ncbi:MAG: DUF1295 domain-containing protein [Oligoflexales bacterium]